jgi:hypothetical protein
MQTTRIIKERKESKGVTINTWLKSFLKVLDSGTMDLHNIRSLVMENWKEMALSVDFPVLFYQFFFL